MVARSGIMSYDIVKTIDQKHVEPTLQALVRQAFVFGLDRISLVRRANEQRGPALVVVMLGAAAIRQIGQFLSTLIADQEQYPEKVLVLHEDRPVYYGLTWLDENGLTWAYHDFMVAGQNCLAFWLVGDRVTDSLAEQLTTRGCMTRLT
jgi:hypothetical protein